MTTTGSECATASLPGEPSTPLCSHGSPATAKKAFLDLPCRQSHAAHVPFVQGQGNCIADVHPHALAILSRAVYSPRTCWYLLAVSYAKHHSASILVYRWRASRHTRPGKGGGWGGWTLARAIVQGTRSVRPMGCPSRISSSSNSSSSTGHSMALSAIIPSSANNAYGTQNERVLSDDQSSGRFKLKARSVAPSTCIVAAKQQR